MSGFLDHGLKVCEDAKRRLDRHNDWVMVHRHTLDCCTLEENKADNERYVVCGLNNEQIRNQYLVEEFLDNHDSPMDVSGADR